MERTLQVTMLGKFSLRLGDRQIDDDNNRMRKVWLLLSYLIYTRNSHTTHRGFQTLIEGPGNEGEDPTGKMKALFFLKTFQDH